nr:MAG TPA: tail connector protein [Caudoviricetes sp.]
MLEDLKSLLGLPEETDEALDKRLNLILSGTKSRLKSLLGGIEPPEELSYIILEVSVIRYNRIGSEGLSAHTVEGESQSFSSNDFAGYMDDIQTYLDGASRKGGFRFL